MHRGHVPSKVPLPVGDLDGWIPKHESAPKQHLDRFSRFCTAYRVPNTQTHTDHASDALRAVGDAA